MFPSICHRAFARFASFVFSVICVVGGVISPAVGDVTITTDTVQDGGTLTVSPSGALIVDYSTDPHLTLTNAATTTGTLATLVGYTAAGDLLINGGSVYTTRSTGLNLGSYGTTVVATGESYLGLNAGSTGTVTVDGAGSAWVNQNRLYVGNSGNGTFNVKEGGQASGEYGYLGVNAGSVGTATVDGVGSSWVNLYGLSVGHSGSGTVNVQSGGQVTSDYGYLGMNADSIGTATVDGAGSVWVNNNGLYVGNSGNGTLTVTNGGRATSNYGYLGMNAGSVGTATVDGAGSAWVGQYGFSVGHSGSGTVKIQNGGQVTGEYGYLGMNAGSVGTATVDGTGSNWVNKYGLYVGNSGNGTLTVQNGGQVTSINGYLGMNAGTVGTATVDGAGSAWVNQYSLSVGNSGNGTLTVQNGGQVMSNTGYLGMNAGSVGTATVDGAGSSWGNQTALYVGNSGNGTLTVQNGGQVTSGGGVLGMNAGSVGTVTVDGLGSVWKNSNELHLGHLGSGTLNVRNGGKVSSVNGYNGFALGSSSVVTIEGAGSEWTNTNSQYIGYNGNSTVNIFNGGKWTTGSAYGAYLASASSASITIDGPGSAWNNSGVLYLGYAGNGTATITNGGQLSSSESYLGCLESSSSKGVVTVNGAGSQWSASSLFIGNRTAAAGSSSLSISQGANVNVSGITMITNSALLTVDGSTFKTGSFSHQGGAIDFRDGLIEVNGGIFSYIKEFVLGGNTTNTHPVFKINGNGFGTSTSHAGALVVGNLSTNQGEFTVSNGGKFNAIGSDSLLGTYGTSEVRSGSSYLGLNAGSTGVATIDGTDSSWGSDQNLFIGHSGSGTLSVQNHATVTSGHGYLGYNTGSIGTATIDGTGSSLASTLWLTVGQSGSGTLTIQNGGAVDAPYVYVGANAGGLGTVTVTGLGSKLQAQSTTPELNVGYGGSGKLYVQNGATVASRTINLGTNSGSTGTAIVDGAGSELGTQVTNLYIGRAGSGSVTVQNGGKLNYSNGYVGYSGAGIGTVTVDGPGSTWGNSSANLYIGRSATGTVNVQNGGSVVSQNAYIGYSAFLPGIGTVKVTGPGTSWKSTNLDVGTNGRGTLSFLDGATLDAYKVYVGRGTSSNGTLTFDGAGSHWTGGVSSELHVGEVRNGTVNILNGSKVTTDLGYLGYSSGSTGIITIDGPGSEWKLQGQSSSLSVGTSGSATLNVKNGGKLTSSYVGIGSGSGTSSTITVDGPGSSLDSDVLYVGSVTSGHGTLNVLNGAKVSSSAFATLGMNSSSTGSATIDGIGSEWNTAGLLTVGSSGTGSLKVQNGGKISSFGGQIGIGSPLGPTGTNSVVVTGTGSEWKNDSSLHIVGGSQSGSLTISNGGRVTNGLCYVGSEYFNAPVLVTVRGGEWTNLADMYLGSGQDPFFGYGTLAIADQGIVNVAGNFVLGVHTFTSINHGTLNTQSLDATFGTFNFNSGTLHVSGAMTLPTSATFTVPSGGTYINDGTVNVPVVVASGGTVQGHGAFGGLTIQAGGTASPGNSPGTMTDASTTLTGGGAFLWEINTLAANGGLAGNATGWDLWNLGQLTVNATNANPFLIKLASLTGSNAPGALLNWNPAQSQQWVIATATNSGGIFGSTLSSFAIDASLFAQYNTLGGQFGLLAGSDGSQLLLTYTAVPEPQSLALLALGLAGLVGIARRGRTHSL